MNVILNVIETIGIVIDRDAKSFADDRDNRRIQVAKTRHLQAKKVVRTARRKKRAALKVLRGREKHTL